MVSDAYAFHRPRWMGTPPYSLKVGGRRSVVLVADVFNIFNSDTVAESTTGSSRRLDPKSDYGGPGPRALSRDSSSWARGSCASALVSSSDMPRLAGAWVACVAVLLAAQLRRRSPRTSPATWRAPRAEQRS